MGMFDFSPDDRPFWMALFGLFGTGGLGYYIYKIKEKIRQRKKLRIANIKAMKQFLRQNRKEVKKKND